MKLVGNTDKSIYSPWLYEQLQLFTLATAGGRSQQSCSVLARLNGKDQGVQAETRSIQILNKDPKLQ